MPQTANLFSFDKIAHLGVFCMLNIFWIVGLKKQKKYPKIHENAVWYATFLSVSYAGILELGQLVVQERNANILDMAFNMAGVGIGLLFFVIIYKFSFV